MDAAQHGQRLCRCFPFFSDVDAARTTAVTALRTELYTRIDIEKAARQGLAVRGRQRKQRAHQPVALPLLPLRSRPLPALPPPQEHSPPPPPMPRAAALNGCSAAMSAGSSAGTSLAAKK